MKFQICLFLSLFLTSLISSQERIHIDEKGDTISQISFQEKWRNKDLGLSRWDSIGKDKKRYTILKKDLYQAGFIDYNVIKTEINNITPIKITDSSTIIIEYYYKDDLCSSTSDNKWTKKEIDYRKIFLDPMRNNLTKDNIVFICLFENGINLKNSPNKKDEYFFLDKNNFIKESRTLCGSHAAIKPNGQILVRNGEYRVDYFAQHLKPKNWSLFFDNKN